MSRLALYPIVISLLAVSTTVGAGQLDLIIGSKHGVFFGDDYYYTKTEVPEYRAPGVGLQNAHVGYTRYDRYDFNESNPGLGYVFDSGVAVGFYRNSYGVQSEYLGYNWQTNNRYLNAGVVVGLVTGYDIPYAMPAAPLAMPYVLIGPSAVRLKVGYIPGAFTFMLNVEL